jgi:SAM-dependent methyltransferase
VTEIANEWQSNAWDGDEGAHWAAHADRYDSTMASYDERLIAGAAIRSHESVLDIGCGCGQTSIAAARAAATGAVLGVDLSSVMLAVADERARAAGLTHARFERADAQVHPFPSGAFDVAVSRCGVMFFDDPVAAFSNIARAMRPGGRIAFIAWQGLGENEWISALRAALSAGREVPSPPANAPGPLGLADPDHVRAVFGAAGFVDVQLDDVREPWIAGTDAEDAFGFLRQVGMVRGMLEDLDASAREHALRELHRTLVEHDTGSGVSFGSATWLLTATRP